MSEFMRAIEQTLWLPSPRAHGLRKSGVVWCQEFRLPGVPALPEERRRHDLHSTESGYARTSDCVSRYGTSNPAEEWVTGTAKTGRAKMSKLLHLIIELHLFLMDFIIFILFLFEYN